jgi:hypothetical protein
LGTIDLNRLIFTLKNGEKTKKEKNTMKKSATKTYSILAILLLSLTSFTLLIAIEPVDGEIISMQWGQLAAYEGSGYNETEKSIADDVCEYINDLFEDDVWGSWSAVDAYWDYTDTEGIETCMVYENNASNGVSFVTNWWVGDFLCTGSSPGPFGHFWFYGDDTNVTDTSIHENANYFDGSPVTSKQYFNFIWTCANGGIYWNSENSTGTYYNITGVFYGVNATFTPPPVNNNTIYGIFDSNDDCVGMPLAWTNTSDMALNGFSSSSGSYTYIGFEANSPFMGDYLPGTSERTDNFPIAFYYAALGYQDPYYLHWDIDDSLDYASFDTYGTTFCSTDLYQGYWRHVKINEGGEDEMDLYFYCKMRVFGNGDMELPYS